jgi:NitT/TauT family transport system ATP-binding protein
MQTISVQGLSHSYTVGRGSLTVLAGVELEVARGEFVSIIGPSGGGKTTLLKAMGGLLEPTEGAVLVEGLHPRTAQRRQEIGFVFQDPSLLPWRTVRRNVTLPLELNGGSQTTDEEPERLLAAVGLADFADYYPHQLSGGMKQRVALARALVLGPSVLLMDEPLGALDEMTRAAMRYELLRLWEISGKTAVMVTHSIPEAVLLSDRVVVMSARPGRVLEQIRIDLPRPRMESQEHSAQFLDHVRRIKETLSLEAPLGASALATHA